MKRWYRISKLKVLVQFRPLRIVVGSAGIVQPGWIDTDIDQLNLLNDRDWQRYFRPDSIEAILAEHVWEHLTEEEGALALTLCSKYLKPGGYLRIAVPDGYFPDPDYIRYVEPGGVGPGADDHKVLYNYQSLTTAARGAGLEVDLLEYFDEHGRFHYTAWDPREGMVHRSMRFHPDNKDGELRYTSLILDARKPG